MTEEERLLQGRLFAPGDEALEAMKRTAHRLSREYSALDETDTAARRAILERLLGEIGEGTELVGPVWFHYGRHTRIGRGCFINCRFTVQDDGPVTIGDFCNFGPNVTIVTPLHPMRAEERRGLACEDGTEKVLCWAKPVTIGADCWLGANVTVCPGVELGEGAVIGAGSVVTRRIPPRTFAAGVPARPIRPITEADSVWRLFEEMHP